MEKENLITAEDCCTYYSIEYSFLHSLYDNGLLEISRIEEEEYIDLAALHDLEKFIRLHYDLNINIEGIEAINHLLNRVQNLQQQINYLTNKVSIFER